MDRRIDRVNTAQRVTKALVDAGYTAVSVSKAADTPMSALNGITPLWVSDLARVGGFLHVHPADLVRTAA